MTARTPLPTSVCARSQHVPAFSRRRGIALLITLTAVLAITSAALLIARHRTISSLESSQRHRIGLCHDQLRAAAAPIRAWLAFASAHVVLPPDADQPMVPVMNETWNAITRPSALAHTGNRKKVPCRVRITAWDQCGMRASIPTEVVQGIDLLTLNASPSPFPSPEARAHGTRQPIAAGALRATHNPSRPGGTARLNLNTAPLPLIAQTLRSLGIDGIDQVAAARARGESVPLTDLRFSSASPGRSLRLVAESNAWAFRIDTFAGNTSRSWWEVWINAGSGWQRVQRLEVP